jgi:hypothetical protein
VKSQRSGKKSELNLNSQKKSSGTPFGFAVDDDDNEESEDAVMVEEQIQPFVPEVEESEEDISEESSPDV